MKGTIDQVEAFFEGIASVWTRVFLFFLTCWVAYFVGLAAACLQWEVKEGLIWKTGSEFIEHSLPADWALSLLWASAGIGGMVTALFLFAAGYMIAFTTIQRMPMLVLVMLVQSWATWIEKVPAGSVGLMIAGDTSQPLPGMIIMLWFTVVLTKFGLVSWRRSHPASDE